MSIKGVKLAFCATLGVRSNVFYNLNYEQTNENRES